MQIHAIVTAPPYAPYLSEIARHPLVSGLRLNTVMPLRESYVETLQRLSGFGQPLWIDLKGRQLRVVGAAIPPYTEVKLSHPIEVDTPTDAFFSDGTEHVRVAAVDGDRLILEDGPRRLVGPGESVNIIDPTLKIQGTLTQTDRDYLAAMREVGLKHVMLSYVEHPGDADEVRELLPDAQIMLKIENQTGIKYAHRHKATQGQLMAARGDLYIEVPRPHKIIDALRLIIKADPNAAVASRILNSFAHHPVPASADISDIAFLLSLGYRTFMLGDAICFQRNTIIEALNLLESIAGSFP